MKRWAAAFACVATVAACGGGSGQPAAEMPSASGNIDIAFSSTPAPLTAGENTLEVTVTGADGQPVTDAEVSVEFFMAAMPAMNMAEMRSQVPLAHEGDGRYRGTGRVTMAGGWQVTVSVTRNGQEVGREVLALTAR